MVFSQEEFASTPTMEEMDQQNKPIRGVSGTSPNIIQSPPDPLAPVVNEVQQKQDAILLFATPTNGGDVSEFFVGGSEEEEEAIDHEFFESFPPGYRFCPKDDELIVFYLKKKIAKDELPRNLIRHVNLYQHSPEIISVRYPPIGEKEWYFFTPRDRKYRNGVRPNRAAGTGYWKATGADKHIKHDGLLVGYRKALVFYEGKPPKGVKTNWIMHEYRVNEPPRKRSSASDMRLDDFVLCRIYKKTDKSFKSRPQNEESDSTDRNNYPIPQETAERFQQNDMYSPPDTDMDMDNKNDLCGLNGEFNIEASSHQFGLHGMPSSSLAADGITASFPADGKCFNNNLCGGLYPIDDAFLQKCWRESLEIKPTSDIYDISPELNVFANAPAPDLDNLMNNLRSSNSISNHPFGTREIL